MEAHVGRRFRTTAILVALGTFLAVALTASATTPIPTTANLWIDQDGGDCSATSSPAAYSDAHACATFQAALGHASAGDTVLVTCNPGPSCTYPVEQISRAATTGARVTIAAQNGYRISFAGTGSTNPTHLKELHRVNIVDIGFGGTATDGNLRVDCSSDVTIVNSWGRRFAIFEGTRDLVFQGGSWGGYGSAGVGEQDSSIGTTGVSGPTDSCVGQTGTALRSTVTFDGVRFHDVYWGVAHAYWAGAHPDCFEINGYTDGVTIENSEFDHCADTFLVAFGNQGPNHHLTIRNNRFHDLGSDSFTNNGVILEANGTSGHWPCGGLVFADNIYEPNNPGAGTAYSPPRIECVPDTGLAPTVVSGNTFDSREIHTSATPPTAGTCEFSLQTAYSTDWHANDWLRDPPCGTSVVHTTANLWIDPDGGSCHRSASPVTHAAGDATACATFQGALDEAQRGDWILVHCTNEDGSSCSYPAETLSRTQGTPTITIAAETGHRVSFEPAVDPVSGLESPVWFDELHDLDFRNIGFGPENLNAGGSGFDANLRVDCSTNVTVTNSSGRRFHIYEGTTGFAFERGSWGNYGSGDSSDSSIGTTDSGGPVTVCAGKQTTTPASVTFDRVAFHDIGTECLDVNGYTSHVTIENGSFYSCGTTFLGVNGLQGANHDVAITGNRFHDLGDSTYYGIQIVANGSGAGESPCGGMTFQNNVYEPNNPNASAAYSPARIECAPDTGLAPTGVSGNVFDAVPVHSGSTPPGAGSCELSQASPFSTVWQQNNWLRDGTCGT